MSENEDTRTPEEREAYELGKNAGGAAGSWVFDGNTDQATYRQYRQWDEDGDPLFCEACPGGPLSGEWADEPTSASLARDLGMDPDEDDTDGICSEYERGFSDGWRDEVLRMVAAQLDG